MLKFEPMGVSSIFPSSRNIIVGGYTEDQTTRTKTVCSAGELIKVSYQTTAGRAKPQEDFEPVRTGKLLFRKFQVEVDFEIIIIDDELPEIEEIFYINLTSQWKLKDCQNLMLIGDHANRDFSVAVIITLIMMTWQERILLSPRQL